uniref:Uncharacterized protein n=1 Tax=Anguilla anguilla TaxID=7936 RepID=A0A0E9WEC9_ANGAN
MCLLLFCVFKNRKASIYTKTTLLRSLPCFL